MSADSAVPRAPGGGRPPGGDRATSSGDFLAPQTPAAAATTAVASGTVAAIVATVPRHPLLDTARPLGRAVRLVAVAGGMGALLLFGVPVCPFAMLTRHPCPGCGLTRATLSLLHGDLHAAAHLHPLVFVITPVIAVAFTYNALAYVRRGDWFASERVKTRWINAAWIALGVATLALWIARFFGAFGGPVPV